MAGQSNKKDNLENDKQSGTKEKFKWQMIKKVSKDLDKSLTPFIKAQQQSLRQEFGKYLFGKFNGKKVYYWTINNEMCFPLKEFANYIGKDYGNVHKSLERVQKKKAYYMNFLEFSSPEDYFEASIKDLEISGQFVHKLPSEQKKDSIQSTVGRPIEIFLTFLGAWKLLATFRQEIPIKLYVWFGQRIYKLLKQDYLIYGEVFLIDNKGKIEAQILGEKAKNFIGQDGNGYSSRGEMIIANLLTKIKIKFQYNRPIYIPKEVKNTVGCYYDYITADFTLKTIPKTVIEYWGLSTPEYRQRRYTKTKLYSEMNIRLVNIEPLDVQDEISLKKKIKAILFPKQAKKEPKKQTGVKSSTVENGYVYLGRKYVFDSEYEVKEDADIRKQELKTTGYYFKLDTYSPLIHEFPFKLFKSKKGKKKEFKI